MEKDRAIARTYCNQQQATRTAWRILKGWIEAQMAIIEAGLASLAEVFLPYALLKDGRTLFDHFRSDKTRLLT
jgi:hypothetical protein